MATITFNLHQSVKLYIDKLNSLGSVTKSDAMELTTHLYDATSGLKAAGLTEEEAFIVACKRIGHEEVLSHEYGKVNATLSTNKIWAYVIIGFNCIFSIYNLLYIGLAFFYHLIYQYVQGFVLSSMLVITFHILMCAAAWLLVVNKNAISKAIDKQVETKGVKTIFFSFMLLAAVFIINYNLRGVNLYALLFYPDYKFNQAAEVSFYLMFLNFALVVVSIVFSIDKPGRVSFGNLFFKPTILLLILYGVVVELIAACTRALQAEVIGFFIFGLVYLFASLPIAFYNKGNIKFLVLFASFGLITETGFGILADLERGNTYFTVFFVVAIVVGVLLGRIVGMKSKKGDEAVYQ